MIARTLFQFEKGRQVSFRRSEAETGLPAFGGRGKEKRRCLRPSPPPSCRLRQPPRRASRFVVSHINVESGLSSRKFFNFRKIFFGRRDGLLWKRKAGSSACSTRLFRNFRSETEERLLLRLTVSAATRGGGDAGQAGAEQDHGRRFGDGGLLRAGDLAGERSGLAGVNG